MSETTANLKGKIRSARDLQAVVRTMKAVAAANIGQYEKSTLALAEYYHAIELGLGVCLRKKGLSTTKQKKSINRKDDSTNVIRAIVFGSDQGLVGQFNDVIADYAKKSIAALSGKPEIWAVGDRVGGCLESAGLKAKEVFVVPTSVDAIAIVVGQILISIEKQREHDEDAELHLFYNRRKTGSVYEPVGQLLLPFDENWAHTLLSLPWPSKNLPETLGSSETTLRALIREYLFVSIFRACSESLASENASRLAAMQRADKNIDELLVNLKGTFHRVRQNGIDEELFDVVSGFEALNEKKH